MIGDNGYSILKLILRVNINKIKIKSKIRTVLSASYSNDVELKTAVTAANYEISSIHKIFFDDIHLLVSFG